MNFTADLVSTALFGLETLKKHVCRVYSASREDIFNLSIKELPEWSIIYKMLFDTDMLDEYTAKHTVFDEAFLEELPQEVIEQAAKFQVEFYFGQTNYHKDEYLKDCEDKDRWIPLQTIYKFKKIKKFHSRLSIHELAQILILSTVVEVA